jgi:hypothetical protein
VVFFLEVKWKILLRKVKHVKPSDFPKNLCARREVFKCLNGYGAVRGVKRKLNSVGKPCGVRLRIAKCGLKMS